jgi:hypothetical protein
VLCCGVLWRVVRTQTISPHILVFWRPEVNQFRAFMVKEAAPGKLAQLLACTRDAAIAAGCHRITGTLYSITKGVPHFVVVLFSLALLLRSDPARLVIPKPSCRCQG